MAVLIAYYLQELAPVNERKEIIDSDDTVKYFKQAGFDLPAGRNGARDTLNNAKKSWYLDSVGTGTFKLNAVGYNLAAYRLDSQSSANGQKKRTKKAAARKPKKA